MNLSDLIVEYLEQFGVKYVFGIPGSPLGPLFDALARSERRGGPRAILCRHEAGAAFIADGYFRESGRIGVCCSTTGPGATNLITGVAAAYAERIPLLVITSQTRLPDLSFGCFQDSSRDGIDIMSMFEHCTRYNSMVTHPNQLERKLAAALTTALGTPGGPSHLSIPIDIFSAEWGKPLSFRDLGKVLSRKEAPVDAAGIDSLFGEISKVLDRGRKITLLVGHSALGAGAEITRFAELTGAEIVTTPRGKWAISPYHPLSRGVFGCSGHASARRALADDRVELILAVGTNLGEWSTSKWDSIVMNHRMVHIHSDRACFTRSPMARLHVTGSIPAVFSRLNGLLASLKTDVSAVAAPERQAPPQTYVPSGIEIRDPEFCRAAQKGTALAPPHLFMELISRLPQDTRFFIDNSNSVPWTVHYFFHPRPECYNLSIEFATMAWAVGAAVGGAFGNPLAPSVCITGDGCYLMSGQEITVAVEHSLPVIFVVMNDGAYGLIRHGHRAHGTERVEFEIPKVDFAMMARAAGAEGYTIRDSEDLERLDWQELSKRQGPTLLDVQIDPEARPPLSMA